MTIVVDLQGYKAAKLEMERLKYDLGALVVDDVNAITEYVEDLDRLIALANVVKNKLLKTQKKFDNWVMIPLNNKENMFINQVLETAYSTGVLDEGGE